MSQNKNPGKETPEKWSSLEDSRNSKKAGKYPNYRVEKTRSGHTITYDDSEGAESITIQHRGGSAMQFTPNGAVQITSHNGLYQVVFGEKRMVVTGAHDVTVKGDGSMRVYGDWNKTVHGNVNWAATGDFNITAENLNRNIRGNIDTQAINETKKLEGSSGLQAQGAIAHVAEKSVTVASHGDQIHLGGAKGANMAVAEGNISFTNEKGNIQMEAKDGELEAKIKSAIKFLVDSGAMHLIAQQAANILSKGGNVNIEARSGNIQADGTRIDLNSGNSISEQEPLGGYGGTATKVNNPSAQATPSSTKFA